MQGLYGRSKRKPLSKQIGAPAKALPTPFRYFRLHARGGADMTQDGVLACVSAHPRACRVSTRRRWCRPRAYEQVWCAWIAGEETQWTCIRGVTLW